MTRSEFDSLVDELEQRYAGRRGALAWRTVLVAAIGYAGFLAWVLAIAALGVVCFVGAFFAPPAGGIVLIVVGACVLGVALWQSAEVLWLPVGNSTDTPLRRNQAPELFALLDRLRAALRMPKIHRVLVNVDMNASIQRQARLGLLGWTRNVMTLGLPVLDMLTPAEFESVAAHECAHLSPRHGRFGAWTYRVRGTWLQLMARMQKPPQGSFSRWVRRALGRFFDWYWQRFHAYFFVTSRSHEYEADRCAANWAGADAAASALWKIDVCGRRMEQRFWPELLREAAGAPLPPADVSRRLLTYFATAADDFDSARWRWHAVAHLTDNSDTHPCLSERVAALGGSLERCGALGVPRPPTQSAARQFFGAQLDEIRRTADQAWAKESAPAWQARHGRAATLTRRLAELDRSTDASAKGAPGLWERAGALFELKGPAAAEPVLRELLALRPNHAAANLAMGRVLLDRGDAEGESYLRRVLAEPDQGLFPEACQALASHYQATGRADDLRSVYDELSLFQQAAAEGPTERTGISARDRFAAAELAPEDLEALQRTLAADADLAEAYLARKRMRLATQRAVFVLCVRTRRGLLGRSSASCDAALVARLIPLVRVPGSVLVIAPHGGFKSLARRIMGVPGSRVAGVGQQTSTR